MALALQTLAVCLVSMLPLVEGKGAVVLARFFGLSHLYSGVLIIVFSYVPVLFLLYTRTGHRIHLKKQRKSLPESVQKYIQRYGCAALLALIAIPFTGLGCYLGAILARVTKLNKHRAAVCIFIGNAIAIAVMMGCVHGIVLAVQHFF